jgi:hypothetical protein
VIKHFLLIYDHEIGKLLDVLEYGSDSDAALKRYGELEAEHRDEPKMDIVLVGSDSLDTIKITHRNYFNDGQSLADIERFLRSLPDRLKASGRP